MKAIELHLGSPIYSVSADEIREYNVSKIELVNGKVNIKYKIKYGSDELEGIDPDATQCHVPCSNRQYYFNLNDAEIAQLVEREQAVKHAHELLQEYQEIYQKMVAKYMLAEPSKPVKI